MGKQVTPASRCRPFQGLLGRKGPQDLLARRVRLVSPARPARRVRLVPRGLPVPWVQQVRREPLEQPAPPVWQGRRESLVQQALLARPDRKGPQVQ